MHHFGKWKRKDKANDAAESVLKDMQMGWESSEVSDDLMLSDVESIAFDLSQASTIPVDEEPSCSVVKDLNSRSDTAPPPLKRQKAVRYEWYFKGSTKLAAGGRLENRLKYRRRKTAEQDKKHDKVKIGSPGDSPSTSSNEDLASTSSQMNYDIADMKVMTEWLKSHDSPHKDVVAKMELTAAYRRDFVHSTLPGSSRTKPCVTDVLDEFPHLLSPGMIEQDYKKLFEGKGDLLFTKWPVISCCILDYGSRMSPGWKVKFGVQERNDMDFSQEEKANLAFLMLSHLFPGKKTSKGGRASSQESLESFIDYQKGRNQSRSL